MTKRELEARLAVAEYEIQLLKALINRLSEKNPQVTMDSQGQIINLRKKDA